MAQFYADEHFPAPVVQYLRALGHDILTIQESGLADLKVSDSEVLREATKLRRAVLTLNRWDFINLHRSDPNHGGIVVCTQNLNFEQFASQIDAQVRSLSPLTGQLVRVYRP